MKYKSAAFHHFGCKVNFSEASALSGKFLERGIEIRDFHEKADLYIISTCVVTAAAEKKCRAAIRQAHRLNPAARIAVIGCFPELKPEELAQMEGVDIVLGHSAKFNLLEELDQLENEGSCTVRSGYADEFVPAFSYGDRTRSFLKIQDGCDYFCSYCTIPMARGRSRSDTIPNVIRNAREIAGRGIQEIVLTGVNIGDYGRHNGENLLQLLQHLDNLREVPRIRISSIEPDLLTDEIIRLVAASERLMPHFHIPLQSGCDHTLKAMHRKYTTSLYASRVEMIRSLMPHACIAADVIAGFPGETDEHFLETMRFAERLHISYMHVFTYSKREKTLAARSSETVNDLLKKQRSDALHRLSDLKKKKFYVENQGSLVKVLFESSENNGIMHGFTENYIRVGTPYNETLANTIVPLRLENLAPDGTYHCIIPTI